MDITSCETEQSKLKWAFKLFDFDNSGSIEVAEMINMMQTLECLEIGDHKKRTRKISYDSLGNPVPVASAADRAKVLFAALDTDKTGYLTLEKFVYGNKLYIQVSSRQKGNL